MNTTSQTFTSPFPAGVDLRAEIEEYEEGGYKIPEPDKTDVFAPTEKSVRLFVGSLERLSLDVGRRFEGGAVDKQLVSDLKVVGDLMLRITQTNLAAKRLALAEAKQSAKAEAAKPTAKPDPKPATTSAPKRTPSPAAAAKKPHPSGLKPNSSRLLKPGAAPPANSRKIERLFSKPSRPIALQAARQQIDSDPDYPEYLEAKEAGWQPLPQIRESNRRIAEIQKREEEAWLAKSGRDSSVVELLPGGPVAPIIDIVDDSKPSQGELLTAIYETDPDFVHYKREKAYHAAATASAQRPATHAEQEANESHAATEHSGNDP